MKVILNKDLATLGEEGDVKDVARGYARNYLFPRGIAFPYNPQTVKLFEARKEAIEERKAQKRMDAMGLKERLESIELTITMPAGANGRLYGAVTSQTLADELAKQGIQIERKRIELAGASFKSAGKYKATVRLYENSSAEVQVTIIGQVAKKETPPPPARGPRRHRDDSAAAKAPEGEGVEGASAPADAAPTEAASSAAAAPAETAAAAEAAGGENAAAGEPAGE